MQSLIVLLLLAGCTLTAATPEDDMTDLSGLPTEVQELIRRDIERRRQTWTLAPTTQTTVAAPPHGFVTDKPSTEDSDLAELPPEIRELILQQQRENKGHESNRGQIQPKATANSRATTPLDLSELPPEIRNAIWQNSKRQESMVHQTTTAATLPPWLLKLLATSAPTTAATTRQPYPMWPVDLERGAATEALQPVPSTEDSDLAELPPEIREIFIQQRRENKDRESNRGQMVHQTTTAATLPPWLLKLLATSAPTTAETTPQPQPRWPVHLERGAATQAPRPVPTPEDSDLGELPPEIRELILQQQRRENKDHESNREPPATPQPHVNNLEREVFTQQVPQPEQEHWDRSRASWLPVRCNNRVDLLRQPKCSSGRSKWTFDAVSGRCEWFAHYGCQLYSGNVFNSRRDCQMACLQGVTDPCSVARCEPISSLHRAECFLARDSVCMNEILSRFMHIADPTMRLAIAQGEIETSCQAPVARCRNVGANFRMPELELPPAFEPPKIPALCRLQPDRGFCPVGTRGRMSRVYYYSMRRNECKFMMHFGCGGNLNRFKSQSECHNACAI